MDSGPSANHLILVKGIQGPEHVIDGDASHYRFTHDTKGSFWKSLKQVGSNVDVSVCAVYNDQNRAASNMAILSAFEGTSQEKEMAFISNQGFPAAEGRPEDFVSTSATSDDLPSHVCWITSSKNGNAATIYINGQAVPTNMLPVGLGSVMGGMHEWRVGGDFSSSDDFEGDIYNIKVWPHMLTAAQVEQEYDSLGKKVIGKVLQARNAPVADYDASKGVTSARWADSSSHGNDLILKGGAGPVFHNNVGIGSYFAFVRGSTHGYWESARKTGISGRDTAITVCAVYRDSRHGSDPAAVLSSWSGVGQGHEMVWFAKHGRPGSDDSTSAGRLSLRHTNDEVPAHVCWTTSKWELQDRKPVTKIYVNGVSAGTQQLTVGRIHRSHAFEGVWRVGHEGDGQDWSSFEGEIWSIKVWQRCLTPADVNAEFVAVGKPIQQYQSGLLMNQQTSTISKKKFLGASMD